MTVGPRHLMRSPARHGFAIPLRLLQALGPMVACLLMLSYFLVMDGALSTSFARQHDQQTRLRVCNLGVG